jgi:hypothetical protein
MRKYGPLGPSMDTFEYSSTSSAQFIAQARHFIREPLGLRKQSDIIEKSIRGGGPYPLAETLPHEWLLPHDWLRKLGVKNTGKPMNDFCKKNARWIAAIMLLAFLLTGSYVLMLLG